MSLLQAHWSWRRYERRRPGNKIHHRSWFCCDTSFSWILLRSFRHCIRANCRTEMANIEQVQQMIPLITREISFGHNVTDLVFGVDVFHLDFGVEVNSIKQPNKHNSMNLSKISLYSTPSFNDHLDHCFIVLIHIQSLLMRETGRLRELNQCLSSHRFAFEIYDVSYPPRRDTVPCQPRSLTLARSNLSTTGPHKPVMPTRSSFQHAKAWFTSSSETNKSVGDTAPQRRLSVRRHQCTHTSSRKWRSTLGVDGPIGIAVVFPILVLFRRGLLKLCGSIWLPVLWLWFVATAKRRVRKTCLGGCPAQCPELIHGKPGNHPSHCAVSKALHRTNESKQLEATRITQAAIQASKLFSSGLLFGLVGRDQRPARRVWNNILHHIDLPLRFMMFLNISEIWDTLPKTETIRSHSSRAAKPSNLNPVSREMISDSVELWETAVCFLHIQLVVTNVWLPKTHNVHPEVDFESSRSPAKSESWNSPSLHCLAVLPT